MQGNDLRASAMMAHLMSSPVEGRDIGHYGRLVFAIVARYFMTPDEVRTWLMMNPGFTEEDAVSLMHQVSSHDYSPPTRRCILEWQPLRDFPICLDAGDPDGCNVQRDLTFPDEVYERIEEYHLRKVAAVPAG